MNALEIKNISLFQPKKDQCATCCSYKMGHITEDIYKMHIDKKNEARAEKEKDKENEDYVFTLDLQAVLLAPRSNVSSLYYKTKLCVHNLTMFNLKTHDGYCYIWNECEGGLNAEEFASIVATFLTTKVIPAIDTSGSPKKKIIIYSDGCTYQNRNITISNALLNVALQNNIIIEQKFLEVGHTQMECDSMHAMMEKN